QISRYGDQIAAVIAANDGTGTASAAALKAGGLDPLPPVTGNDATLAGTQLVLTRQMWNTISKPGAVEAWAAANAAVALIKDVGMPQLEGGKKTTLFK